VSRDYERIARLLRAKAEQAGPEEASVLRQRADELEAKYKTNTPPSEQVRTTAGFFTFTTHVPWSESDYIESRYLYDEYEE
jgi:hypothetical protein